jgi:hypothetical protein
MGLMDDIGDVARKAAYIAACARANLRFIKKKPGQHSASRGTTVIDEIRPARDRKQGNPGAERQFPDRDGQLHPLFHRARPRSRLLDHLGGPAGGPCGKSGPPPDRAESQSALDRHRDVQKDISLFQRRCLETRFHDWQYDTVAMLVYDIRRRRKIARNKVVGHSAINSIDRADPATSIGPVSIARSMSLSWTLGGLLGSEFLLDPIIPGPLMMIRRW